MRTSSFAEGADASSWWIRGALGLGLTGLLLVVLRSAFVCDDYYHSLKAAWNLAHGYGLLANPGERVQGFTNPLWTLLLAIGFLFSENNYLYVIFLSVAATIGCALLLLRGAALPVGAALLGLAVMTGSKAFVDFSTSGLENPLAHLLVLAFLVSWGGGGPSPERTLRLGLLASALTLTRLDLALLVAPALALTLRPWSRSTLGRLALGLGPILFWELFSLVYYGTPVPNTAWAKLGDAGLGRAFLLHRGWCYVVDSLVFDRVTLPVILLGVLAAALHRDRRVMLPVAAGVLLYLSYIVWIGGDFMVGRFLSAPLAGAIWLVCKAPVCRRWWLAGAGAVLVLGASLSSERTPLLETGQVQGWDFVQEGAPMRYRVGDARLEHMAYYGFMLRWQRGKLLEQMDPVAAVEQGTGRRGTVVVDSWARPAYSRGPWTYSVNRHGLTDPLLARMPPEDDEQTWAGHVLPRIPEGYLESLRAGRNLIKDPAVAALYDDLLWVTRGPLLAPERWAAIWWLHTGYHKLAARR